MNIENISHHQNLCDLIDLRPDFICQENMLEELRNLKSDLLILTKEMKNIKMARKIDIEEMNNIKISNKMDLDEIGIKFSNKMTTMNFMINQKQKEHTEANEQKWNKFQEENFARIHRFKEQIIAKFIVENNELKRENAKLKENIEELKLEINGIKCEIGKKCTAQLVEKIIKKNEMKKKRKMEKKIKKMKKKKMNMDDSISNYVDNGYHDEEQNACDLDGIISFENSCMLNNETTNLLIKNGDEINEENLQQFQYNIIQENPSFYGTFAYLNAYDQRKQFELLRRESFNYTVDFEEPKHRRMIVELKRCLSGKKFIQIYVLEQKYNLMLMDPNEIKLFTYFPNISLPADTYILLNSMRALYNDLEEIRNGHKIREKHPSLICCQLVKGGFRYDYKLEFHLHSKTKHVDFRMQTLTTQAKPTHKPKHLRGPIPIDLFHWLKEQMTEMLIT